MLFGLVAVAVFALGAFVQSKVGPALTKQSIDAAEDLIGLEFSDAERDSMLEGLTEQRDQYDQLRKRPILNSIPPSLWFNPLPVGFQFPPSGVVRFSDPPALSKPAKIEEVAFYSVSQLGSLIRSKQISSETLTRMYLSRLKTYGRKLECVVTLTEELAIEQARQADREIAAGTYRGPLHGIPYGAKDLLATKGIRTTWGSVPFSDQVFDNDAEVIKRLREAGAVLVAKLSMGELAWGDVWFGGKTRNPWNVSEGSSGSSAGSASAVSAGLVGFAIGTETWGSIVSPATVCGVTGLRPTYGRVSRTGVMALSWSMDKIGPMCRTVEDCAIVFNALRGPDGKDQSLIDAPFAYSPHIDLSHVRIGYLKSDFDSVDDRSHNERTFGVLRSLGAELIPVELPKFPANAMSIILSAEAAAAFDDLTRGGKDDLLVRQIKNAWPNVFRQSRFIPAVEYIQSNRLRFELIQEMKTLMEKVDVYLAPPWEGDNLLLTNLTGHPCVVLPNGFSKAGTPVSVTFVGGLFDEGQLLAVAKRYQDATDFHQRHPSMEALSDAK